MAPIYLENFLEDFDKFFIFQISSSGLICNRLLNTVYYISNFPTFIFFYITWFQSDFPYFIFFSLNYENILSLYITQNFY